MDVENRSTKNARFPDSTDGLSRRNVLMKATVAASALTAAPSVLAATVSAGAFGAPLVEVHVPAGVLTLKKKSPMKKGIPEVVLGATKQPPDPAKRLFVQIFETAEGGFGVNGQVFVPRSR